MEQGRPRCCCQDDATDFAHHGSQGLSALVIQQIGVVHQQDAVGVQGVRSNLGRHQGPERAGERCIGREHPWNHGIQGVKRCQNGAFSRARTTEDGADSMFPQRHGHGEGFVSSDSDPEWTHCVAGCEVGSCSMIGRRAGA
ncbi:hypothetical protein D3C73_1408280 [compost metagenome]